MCYDTDMKYFTTIYLSFLLALPALAEELPNPLGPETDTPNEVIANIIQTVLGIVGGITLLIFVYGGFLFLTSAGNEQRVKLAKDTLMWATLGLIVIFGSYGFAEALFNALSGAAS